MLEETEVSEQSAEEVTETSADDIQVSEPAKEEEKVEEKAEEKIPPPEPRKQTAQERIDEITKLRRDAEREVEYWKQRALDTQPKVDVKTRPKLEDFNSNEEYEDAHGLWLIEKREAEQSAKKAEVYKKETERREQEKAVEAEQKFMEKANEAKKDYPDFDTVIQTPVYTPVMKQAILDSDNGAVLAYNLGLPENRDLVFKIASLPVNLQWKELGKFETQLIITNSAKKKTSAPPPIKPLGGNSGGTRDTSKETDEEYFAKEEAIQREKYIRRLKSLGG